MDQAGRRIGKRLAQPILRELRIEDGLPHRLMRNPMCRLIETFQIG
jgi:hypothetical protein